jgi:hypothetical protein
VNIGVDVAIISLDEIEKLKELITVNKSICPVCISKAVSIAKGSQRSTEEKTEQHLHHQQSNKNDPKGVIITTTTMIREEQEG